jgi:hypothetical protein
MRLSRSDLDPIALWIEHHAFVVPVAGATWAVEH